MAGHDGPEQAVTMARNTQLSRDSHLDCRYTGVTQKEAAHRLGITQPRLNDLLNGRINKFSLDALVNLTGPAHFHLELAIEDEKEAAA
ncbi:helix-turn-helix domain-containing protein [Halomonas sp. MA07-2]|uniref:helix-turn-helix domain-containing protein n=1 Tax=Halomonas sp. MA07-2 TaxID=3440841 RepID=UPI003EEBE23D